MIYAGGAVSIFGRMNRHEFSSSPDYRLDHVPLFLAWPSALPRSSKCIPSLVQIPFSFWSSSRSFPHSHLWPLDGSHPSLHCWLAINHTLAGDISCIALSCYLSLVYSFAFLAFMSYLFKFPESTEHIFGILFSPSVPCSLVIAAL